MRRGFLTQFQTRKLAAVAAKMNDALRNTVPGHTENVFEPCFAGADGDLYAVMPNREANGIDPDIINGILSAYNSSIQTALRHRNPFSDMAAVMTSIIIWETPDAFQVDEKNPKTLKNNSKSPFYADNAMMNSWPPFMNMISAFAQVEMEMAMRKCDIILGGESRGIPFATYIAKDLARATGIVRKEIKAHGTKKGVEGGLLPGDIAVVVEDLTTDGGTKGPFVNNIRAMKAEITDILVVFDRKQGAKDLLKNEFGVDLHSLTDISVHLETGLKYGYISAEEYQSIQAYLEDPKKWNIDRNYGWPITMKE